VDSTLKQNIAAAVGALRSLEQFETQIKEAAALIVGALTSGHKLMACGNGGSAADAAHFTTEFVCRYDADRRAYPAICLGVHAGDLTAIANDYSFDDIFSRQVQAFATPGDVLVAFSSSGNSENVRRALALASDTGVKSVALLGRTGGHCAGLATVEFIVRSEITARIQECHKFLLHTICQLVDMSLQPRR
jgi:D-sedoheptulose 7-phosphate isomerase